MSSILKRFSLAGSTVPSPVKKGDVEHRLQPQPIPTSPPSTATKHLAIDTDEIEFHKESTQNVADDLLNILLDKEVLIQQAEGNLVLPADDKKILRRFNEILLRLPDYGTTKYIDPNQIQEAFDNRSYTNHVYNLNLAILAHDLFLLDRNPSASEFDQVCSNFLQWVASYEHADAFTHVIKIYFDIEKIQLFVNEDPASDFYDLLDSVFQRIENYDVNDDQLNALNVAKNELEKLDNGDSHLFINIFSQHYNWQWFIHMFTTWAKEYHLKLNNQLTSAEKTLLSGIAHHRRTRKRSATDSGPEVVVSAVPVDTSSSKGTKRRFNDRQDDAEKLAFDTQDTEPSEINNFLEAPLSPSGLQQKRTVRADLEPADGNNNAFAILSENQLDEEEILADQRRSELLEQHPGLLPPKRYIPMGEWVAHEASLPPSARPRKQGTRWTTEMEEVLIDAIERYGTKWSEIEKAVKRAVANKFDDAQGRIFPELKLLEGRSQVNLKDKARNIKHGLILSGKPIPKCLDTVTVSSAVLRQKNPHHDYDE
ncbi:hypothetical protein V1514DRAFT_366660 [Lipomyces japonicus]|uniref:uncharacterized protein n=1 Tax=Lipomyces japonicus TaxID=56871 RepID=UPI0034CFF997